MEARSERKEHRLTLLPSSFDLAALLVSFDTLLKLVTTFRDYNPVIFGEHTLSLLMIFPSDDISFGEIKGYELKQAVN